MKPNLFGGALGLAGLSFGVLFYLFEDVLTLKFNSIDGEHAYAIVMALMIFTFGIAVLGLVVYFLLKGITPGSPIPGSHLGAIVFLAIAVLVAAGFRASVPSVGTTTADASGNKSTQMLCVWEMAAGQIALAARQKITLVLSTEPSALAANEHTLS